MNLMLMRAAAALVLAAHTAGLGAGAAQAACVEPSAAAQAAGAGAVVQAAGVLRDSEPPVKPTPPDPLTMPGPVVWMPPERPPLPPNCTEEEKRLAEEAYQRELDEFNRQYAEYERQYEEHCRQIEAQYEQEYAQYLKDLERYQEEYNRWYLETHPAEARPELPPAALNPVPAPDPASGTAGEPKAPVTPDAPGTSSEPNAPDAPGTGSEPKAPATPDAPDEDAGETETPAAAPELTPEQLAAILRMFGQNASYASQQEAIEAQRRAEQQKETVVNTPVPVQFKNLGTEEQAERLDGFLAEHPHGSTWDESNIYKNYGACAAFAMQAQQTIFGEDADYTCSDRYEDIRQYSAVKVRLTSGTHWVFILEVNEDGSFRTADGNVNGKVRIGFDRNLNADSILQVWNPAA